MTVGDRVMVIGDHPWATHAGTLIAYERYGLGWRGWRVKLDGNCGECYASESEMLRPVQKSIQKSIHRSDY
jgi:hypothetical protein